MNFQSQATFGKVRNGSPLVLQKYPTLHPENNIPQSHTPLVSRIIAYRHEFVFEEILEPHVLPGTRGVS